MEDWAEEYEAQREHDARHAKQDETDRLLSLAYYLIDQCDCLTVEGYPSLYAAAQKWKADALKFGVKFPLAQGR